MKIFIQNHIKEDHDFLGHTISHMDYENYLTYDKKLINYFKHGISGNSLFAKLRQPEFIQNLYQTKDKEYFRFLNKFREKYKDYDVIVMNPGVDLVHPEYLHKHFKNSLKVLHFIDDPHATYNYCLPYAWTFDAATYISPSYSQDFDMSRFLNLVGFKSTFWTPLSSSNINPSKWTINELEEQLRTRNKEAVYFGNFYSGKIERLITLKKKLKNKFKIYGKFPLKGLSFFLYSLLKKNPTMCLPSYLTNYEREKVYENTAIGINMHLSHPAIETGNARTYELAYRGVAQVVDTSDVSLIENIFEPNVEILTYENIDECVFKTKKLIEDDDLRTRIALAAYKKATEEYSYSKTFERLINWFKTIIY